MSMMKRSVMTLFSGRRDMDSHRVRIVLAEKAVAVDVVEVGLNEVQEDLLAVNPYNTVPTLIDRELILYDAKVIMEYLDERFPHPPLLPVYPVARAKCRLMIFRIESDWYRHVEIIESGSAQKAEAARAELSDHLTKLAPVFADMLFFLNKDFSLLDCCIAPLLWRLPTLGVSLPKRAKAVLGYAERVFARESFQASLTVSEQALRDCHAF